MSMETIHFLPSTELRYYTVSVSSFSLFLLRYLPGGSIVGMRPRRRSLRRTRRRLVLFGRRRLPLLRKNLRRTPKLNQQENVQLGVYQPVWRRKRVLISVKPPLTQLSLTKNQRLREPPIKCKYTIYHGAIRHSSATRSSQWK